MSAAPAHSRAGDHPLAQLPGIPYAEPLDHMIGRENLMDYLERLDGVVEVSIGFNVDGTATLTISQIE